MSKSYLSGAAKRQAREERAKKAAKMPKISAFLKPADTSPAPMTTLDVVSESNLALISAEVVVDMDIDTKQSSTSETTVAVTLPMYSGNENESISITSTVIQGDIENPVESLTAKKYPSDKANFRENLSHEDKRLAISFGPCQPSGPFPRDPAQKGRCFSEAFYTKVSQAGVKLKRTTLSYSPDGDCVYCHACWLFAKNRDTSWIRGFHDWGHLTYVLDIHEKSVDHIQCCMILEQWRLNKTLTAEMEDGIRKEASYWRQVLDRIINVTLMLAGSNLAFRGHREHDGGTNSSENSGNFLSVINLLARYDPVLEKLLSMTRGTVKYLSPTIQNEVISMVARCIKEDILSDIKAAPFFSVMVDTTQDISKTDQLSQIIRYVSIETDGAGKPERLKICESFIGFLIVDDQSASGLCDIVVNNCITGNGLELAKLRGQGYDGAASMSGIYSGVQARIVAKQPKAVYVHCAAHNLNLVLNDAVSDVIEVKNFFGVLEQIYVFFGHSILRWSMLSLQCESRSNLTLKRLCPTRWSSRYDCLFALRYRFVDVLKVLTTLILTSKKKDEVANALAIKRKVECFDFVFILAMMTKIMEATHGISKLLQSPQCDLSKANDLIKSSHEKFQSMRNEYDSIRETAVSMAKAWNIKDHFEDRRLKKTKRLFDEICHDESPPSTEKRFRVNVFLATVDRACGQIKQRFLSLSSLTATFSALLPSTLMDASDDELYAAAEMLAKQYDTDISLAFPTQLLSFRSSFRSKLSTRSTIFEIAQLLLVDYYALSSTFSDVCTAYMLLLTLPVTVATCERSFSKLKLIKNYLRSTMSEERLSDLAMLSIENEHARKLDTSKVVDIFAQEKARKRTF